MQPTQLIEPAIALAKQAGEQIRDIFLKGQFERHIKSDNTPVTSADLASHQILIQGLQALTPETPVLSEEAADIGIDERRQWQRYWLVDPLDGTGEFIAGSDDFSVIIALVENNRPILGIVYAPMTQTCYYALAGHGAYKRIGEQQMQINSQDCKGSHPLRLAISRRQNPQSMLDFMPTEHNYQLIKLGGAALKACLVAEGAADCYVRVGPTGEWDTGAAQIIVEEAGGRIMDIMMNPLTYNQRDTFENPNFIVVGDPQKAWDEIVMTP